MPASTQSNQAAPPSAAVVGLAVGGCYMCLLMWAIGHTNYEIWGSLLLVPLLIGVSAPFLIRSGVRELGHGLAQLLVLALVLKLLSALARYYMAYEIYDGVADSEGYHTAGQALAVLLRHGGYEQPPGPLPGTAWISVVTGVVYAIFGVSKLGGFFVFSWIGFWGLFLFFRGFCIGFPHGDRRRYAVLVLLLPSLLFWPSSIGKESWMMLMLGASAYGTARLLTRHRGGLPVILLGLSGAAVVRPHMALLVLASVLVGYVVRPSSGVNVLAPVAKLGVVLVLVAAGTVLVMQAERFFGVEQAGSGSVSDVLDRTTARTEQGGSSFETRPVRSPVDLPFAAVNVLFRPFPHEARNLQSLVAALEGLGLMVLVLLARRRLRALPRVLRRNPFLVFALVYTLLFVIVFSSFSNFGILTRQRVQVLPFLLVFLALPLPARRPAAGPFIPIRPVTARGEVHP